MLKLRSLPRITLAVLAIGMSGCFQPKISSYSTADRPSGGDGGGGDNQPVPQTPSSTVRLIDRVQFAGTLYEVVKPIDATIPADQKIAFKNSFYSLLQNQVLARQGEFGRPCIYGEAISASDAEKMGDLNCKDDNSFRPDQMLVPQDTGGRMVSHISACERVSILSTKLTLNGANKDVYAVEGFKAKIAAATGVAITAIAFQKTGGAYTVSDAHRNALIAAYQLFYPGEIPSEEVLTSLKNVVTATSGSSTVTPDPAWSNVFLAICLSPGWQTL